MIKYFIILILSISFLSGCGDNESNTKISEIDALANSQIDNISQTELKDIFTLFSDFTDLQREKKEKEIKGKVVVWDQKVYEVESTKKSNVYRIATSSDMDIFDKSATKIGTTMYLTARDASEVQKIEALKTGDVIKIKGRIDEVSFRQIYIKPAIFYDPLIEARSYIKSIVKNTNDCPMPIKDSDLIIPVEVLLDKNKKFTPLETYIHDSGYLVINYSRGNHSSDIEIYNLFTNEFLSINNLNPKNNEKKKLTTDDISSLRWITNKENFRSCKFKDNLVLEDRFLCSYEYNGKNHISCGWVR